MAKNQEQCVFVDGVAYTLEDLSVDPNGQIIFGGDVNICMSSHSTLKRVFSVQVTRSNKLYQEILIQNKHD